MIRNHKKGKRLLRTGAVALTLGLLLTGCGNKTTGDTGGASTAEPSTAEPSAADPSMVKADARNLAEGVERRELKDLMMNNDHSKALSTSAVKLLQKTMELAGNPKENYLISPVSIQLALGMLTAGAEEGSETEKELMELLLPGENAKTSNLNEEMATIARRMQNSTAWNVADSIWLNESGNVKLTENYLSDAVNYYQAELYAAPFDSKTVDAINNWVKKNTKDRIPTILNQLDSQAALVLVNALAFDGEWITPYTEYQINTKGSFTNADGTVSEATMLSSEEHGYVSIAKGEGFLKWYKDSDYAFVALLPPEGVSTEEYLKNILSDEKALSDAIKNADYEPNLQVEFPEFKAEYGANLNDTLKALGVKKAYSEEAEFGKMITEDSNRISVDEVMHKAMIEVDRNGTKAAAATAIAVTEAAIRNEIFIRLNRPFIYGIVDMSAGIPVFLGVENKLN